MPDILKQLGTCTDKIEILFTIHRSELQYSYFYFEDKIVTLTVYPIRLKISRGPLPFRLTVLKVFLLLLLFFYLLPGKSIAADLSYHDKELSELISLINDSDFEVRHKATEALEFRAAELKSRPADIARLIRQLDYKHNWDKWVVSKVLRILKAVGKPAAPLLLSELDKDPDKKEKWYNYKTWISSVYIEIDPQNALPWAISFLKSADSRQINIPTESFAKLGKPAVGPLIEILEDDATSLRTKRWVISILGRMDERDEQITKALTKMLEHPNPYIRMDAEVVLTMNFQRLLDDLENPKIVKTPGDILFDPQRLRPQFMAEAIKRLGRLKDRRAIMPLISRLGEYDPSYYFLDQVLADALKEIGNLPVEPFAAILLQREDDPTQGRSHLPSPRRKAAILLAFTEDKAAAVPYLIHGLEDEDVFVRIEATRSLGVIGSPAIDPLIEALSAEKLWVREGAVKALGAIQYSEGIEALLPLLQDESWYIRYFVGSTLAGECKKNALPHLRQALKKETNPLVRTVLKKAKWDIRLRSIYRFLGIPRSMPIF